MKYYHINIFVGLLFILATHEVYAQAFWALPEAVNGTIAYVYSGEVAWVEQGKVRTDSIVWTMRILASVARSNIRAWKITGHPMDLAWYKPGMKPVMRTIVEVAGKSYYISTADVFDRIRNPKDSLRELVWESELALDLPLSRGRAFGENEMLKRKDGLYVWRVEDVIEKSVTPKQYQYTVIYRASNLIILTEWKKGDGLVRYRYRHYGSSSDCDVRLERTIGVP